MPINRIEKEKEQDKAERGASKKSRTRALKYREKECIWITCETENIQNQFPTPLQGGLTTHIIGR